MKKGLSLVSLAIVIMIMVILAGIIIVAGFNSTQSVAISTFGLEILNIQNSVDEYKFRHEKYPVGESKVLNLSQIQAGYHEQFSNEDITNNQITFKIIDLKLIGINNTEYGKNKNTRDVYVLSEKTGKVYYLEGVDFEDNFYYTLTEGLYSIIKGKENVQITSNDVKVYDVIFTPSTKEITNEPVTLKVRLPKDAIINSIIATNSKSVSQESIVGMYKQINVNTEGDNRAGNYKITVNYTYNNTEKTAVYEVTNHNSNVPKIEYTENIDGDLKTITVNIKNNDSDIIVTKYENEIVSNKEYFNNYGEILSNNKFVIKKDDYFTIYVKTKSGLIVTENNLPDSWKENVCDVVDGVPIPKGFMASPYVGENRKKEGLVIYELNENENEIPASESQMKSLTTRNQYVWVPVEDFSKFVRKNFGMGYNISNTLGTGYWETELETETNEPVKELDTNYMTPTTLAEVQALYKSVKEYKGFYIARYEAGVDDQRTSFTQKISTGKDVHSKMGKIPYSYIYWNESKIINKDEGGAIGAARSVYPNNIQNTFGAVSTLIYGVQWDAAVQWFVDTQIIKTEEISSTVGSKMYGNYADTIISSKDDLNEMGLVCDRSSNNADAYVPKDNADLVYPKVSGTKWILSTGALKASRLNNVYDMAGNMMERTMEGGQSAYRSNRGGAYASSSTVNTLASRYADTLGMGGISYGFRVSLYIKL